MRKFCLSLCLLLPLGAGPSLRVVAVERVGWPPFEDDRRIYRLAGENVSQLRPGEILQLVRPGDPSNPGRLKVASVEGERASAYLDARGATYPLVGDEAWSRRLAAVPGLPSSRSLPDVSVHSPRTGPPPELVERAMEAPAIGLSPPAIPAKTPIAQAPSVPLPPPRVTQAFLQRESIYFLEGDGSLSPKGREKLQVAVSDWGAEGRWKLALPENRLLPEKVRQSRIQGIRKALGTLGVGRVDIQEVQRLERDTGDVVYVEKD
jgi:hypothetical protein